MRDAKRCRKAVKSGIVDISGDYHAVVGGISKDKLTSEEMELYRFMVGGVQAK